MSPQNFNYYASFISKIGFGSIFCFSGPIIVIRLRSHFLSPGGLLGSLGVFWGAPAGIWVAVGVLWGVSWRSGPSKYISIYIYILFPEAWYPYIQVSQPRFVYISRLYNSVCMNILYRFYTGSATGYPFVFCCWARSYIYVRNFHIS